MAFDNVTFPTVPLIHDQRRSVIDPVSILSNGNYEYRVKRQQWEKFAYEVPAQTMTPTQKESVRQFLMQRNNGLNAFKYNDPDLSVWSDVKLSHAGGSNWYLYLPFDSSTAGNTHPLFNQTPGDFTAEVNSSPASITSYQLVGGVPTFTITGATSAGDDVRLTGTAYFNVRLDSSFSDTLYALCTDNSPRGHQVTAIRLMEVHGEV